ncbi:MAG: cob(I)yrinic acid a,c-diamide adenosyltransferase [Chloroflexota bacterium]
MTKKQIFYTRAGDEGTTTIYGQKERLPKYALRPEAYGIIDEAQAVLGILRASDSQPRTKEMLVRVERDLYLMMGQLAVADNVKLPSKAIDQTDVDWLEQATEEIGETTGGFTDFVLPGDTLSGAQTHLARTIVRRAERAVARLYHEEGLNNIYILRYLNRLSSLLFVLALYEDHHGGVETPTYAKHVRD